MNIWKRNKLRYWHRFSRFCQTHVTASQLAAICSHLEFCRSVPPEDVSDIPGLGSTVSFDLPIRYGNADFKLLENGFTWNHK